MSLPSVTALDGVVIASTALLDAGPVEWGIGPHVDGGGVRFTESPDGLAAVNTFGVALVGVALVGVGLVGVELIGPALGGMAPVDAALGGSVEDLTTVLVSGCPMPSRAAGLAGLVLQAASEMVAAASIATFSRVMRLSSVGDTGKTVSNQVGVASLVHWRR